MKSLSLLSGILCLATFNGFGQSVTRHDRLEESVHRGETYHSLTRKYEIQDDIDVKHVVNCTPLHGNALRDAEPATNYLAYAQSEQAVDYGFQFESSPAQLDMIEFVKDFEVSRSENQPITPANKLGQNEHMVKILALSAADAETFLEVYLAYEQELENIVRKVDDVVTAAQRQAVLKEKYFETLNNVASAYLAYRFLAWVDYYAQTCVIND